MPKNPSLKKVAKTYKKNTKFSKPEWSGSHYFTGQADPHGLATNTSKTTYKPKAKQITVGGTRKGKGATIKKLGKY